MKRLCLGVVGVWSLRAIVATRVLGRGEIGREGEGEAGREERKEKKIGRGREEVYTNTTVCVYCAIHFYTSHTSMILPKSTVQYVHAQVVI